MTDPPYESLRHQMVQNLSQDLGVKKDLVLLEAIKQHTGDSRVELDKLVGRLHRTYFTGDKIECWYLDDHPIVEFYRVEYVTDDMKFKVEQRYRFIAPPIPRPRCYNRPAFLPGYWGMHGRLAPGEKLRYRWVEHRMTTDCGSWKVMEGCQDPEPKRLNWNCDGCRWKPEGV